ncbi:MAG: glycine--tRNA ligase [Patescibacteria group bacterium]|nr:glycine--tRNA ligase [Patescibacteria group bacterium]
MDDTISKIISLTKRRGFIFPSSEIYGGFGSSYDFGPLGVEMKRNLKQVWWSEMINNHEDIVGLDAAILMNPKVWQASGHLAAGFADELTECQKCKKRFKKEDKEKDVCPECGGKLGQPRKFNLMMKTFVGPVEDEASIAYLRAETCQGIYVNFENIRSSMRKKLPFGIAQIGKSFRNEINPKNFIFRTREFEQMEMQWFCNPKEADKWFDYWKEERVNWYLRLGIDKKDLRVIEIDKKDRAHYAQRQADIEYRFPFGWGEIEGIHNRGDWDLSNHSKNSGQDLRYFNEEVNEKYFPHIIETSVGVERSLFVFLVNAYKEIKGGRTTTTEAVKEQEVVMKFDKNITPIKAIILPLVKNNPKIVAKAKEVYKIIKPKFSCQYDQIGSIGRRYRRADEIGVIFALTIDFQTLEDNTITVRDRDTMKQERIKIDNLMDFISEKLNN